MIVETHRLSLVARLTVDIAVPAMENPHPATSKNEQLKNCIFSSFHLFISILFYKSCHILVFRASISDTSSGGGLSIALAFSQDLSKINKKSIYLLITKFGFLTSGVDYNNIMMTCSCATTGTNLMDMKFYMMMNDEYIFGLVSGFCSP
jgi:hypothetical protein